MSKTESVPFAPRHAETGEVLELAMQDLLLTGEILPAGARLVVRHRFQAGGSKPAEVIYAFMLGHDAAMRSFRIEGEAFQMDSKLSPVEEAEAMYEAGISNGHLAGLAKQYQDGMVNLAVGNIRPGETVTVYLEILTGLENRDGKARFRFPFTVAPGYHARARSSAAAPGIGEIELPADQFGDMLLPAWHQDPNDLHTVSFNLTVHAAAAASPSHALRTSATAAALVVSLAPGEDYPNRDLVLDLEWEAAAPQLFVQKSSDGDLELAALLPSTGFGKAVPQPRRVVFLVDRSGSMDGKPMAQAHQAVLASLAALAPQDKFGLVLFDHEVVAFADHLLSGSKANREKAAKFLRRYDAAGGTELAAGIAAAANLLEQQPGDVILVTDGQVWETLPIVDEARATGIRLHCLAIGSAGRDRFLDGIAEATGGTSRSVTARERIDMAAIELFAAAGQPVATELQAALTSGQLAPAPGGAVHAGKPVLLFGHAPADAILSLAWTTAGESRQLQLPLTAATVVGGDSLRLLRGAQLIAQAELQRKTAATSAAAEQRQRKRQQRALANLSVEYGLASEAMALVAVHQRSGDQAGIVPETRVVPVGMPEDTSYDAYFGGNGKNQFAARALHMHCSAPGGKVFSRMAGALNNCFSSGLAAPTPDADNLEDTQAYYASEPSANSSADDQLLDLVQQLEDDGGMPGKKLEQRVALSVALLLALLEHGHTADDGAFRSHVQKLRRFLQQTAGNAELRPFIDAGLAVSDAASIGSGWLEHTQAVRHGALDLASLQQVWQLTQ